MGFYGVAELLDWYKITSMGQCYIQLPSTKINLTHKHLIWIFVLPDKDKTHPDYFDITERVEMATMASLFFNKGIIKKYS